MKVQLVTETFFCTLYATKAAEDDTAGTTPLSAKKQRVI